ncbi:hypothetical protein MSG28_001021 [Choristoneura fumiferana]|uniref:Uncharacterized protein n=1 Tax=Choristoneura fumiferana TaxID=7141 RepID=A0ACC0K3Z9_CHOFU|nr:hypothetical protein MSG28_001021 [Choristoneura fumiferana]
MELSTTEKECQAREAEEDRKLDIELLHQRAIEAEAEQKREIAEAVEEVRGMNTSWSHHGLCELPRMATRWRHSRPSIPDTHYKYMLKKACSAQLTKPHSIQSITECDNWINLSRLSNRRDESVDSDCCEVPGAEGGEPRAWRASANDVSPQMRIDLDRAPSCPGGCTAQGARPAPSRRAAIQSVACAAPVRCSTSQLGYIYSCSVHKPPTASRRRMRRHEMQYKGAEGGGKEGSQMSRSESSCTPHTPPGPPASASVDSNMPTIYR